MDRKSLIIVISVLVGLNSAILMDYLGIHIPLVRQIFGFVALTFLPGYLLLKIFRTKLESFLEGVFLSVALSVSVVMFVGIFANFIYPLLGIEKPITLGPILITFNVIIIALLFIQQKQTLFTQEIEIYRKIKITKWDLFFLLLPFVSLLSAYRFSFYGDNRGLLTLYFLVSLTPIIFVKVRNFNRTFAIWSIAISLMWSTVFGMSWNYIWGYDINGEYHYANLILSRGIWDISVYYAYNTVASVNILAPIYSLILNTGVVLVFKVIYPLIFSLVPIILLKAYERLLGKKVWAGLSVLFIVFFFHFFFNTMALARMMIVELYLALLVYATVKRVNTIFLMLFLASLAVSHYGTAYLTMFALLALIPFSNLKPLKGKINNINIVVAFFWAITLLWYQYTGGGFEFHVLTDIGYQTFLMLGDILNFQYSQGLYLIVSSQKSLLRQIAKWINLTAQGLIVVGVLTTVRKLIRNKSKEYLEFYAFSLVFFAYDVAGVVVPFFANRMNVNRLYHLTQFFIAPYLLIGFNVIKEAINSLSNIIRVNHLPKDTTKIASIFIIIYFLFTSGWSLVIAKDSNPPMWLEKIDSPVWSISEIIGGKWIVTYRYDDLNIYSDQYRALLFLGLMGQGINKVSFRGERKISNLPKGEAYVYLGKISVKEKKILVVNQKYLGTIKEFYYLSIYDKSIFGRVWISNKIYSSQNVAIYKT
ncbi:DUF2206 domain-containing protein [Pyrococcus sp. ST04]|uniref:DUF2206 domain-containing protein n=1 Tax=Pyrococcus sp. ST04 TaxID=1183377 RepID=UPI0002605A7F|nr:DUF2206 domain-containing protein [Pyrococcus sp. ST04]AFK22064.1 hypothetical protein Py04_0462 [Pyrococcus sp. ST04]